MGTEAGTSSPGLRSSPRNSAFKLITERDVFRRWQRTHRRVGFVQHNTQGGNKNSQTIGVESLLPSLFRQGLFRIPRKGSDLDALHLVRSLVKEAIEWPESQTNDLMMALWQPMVNMPRVLIAARRDAHNDEPDGPALPPYLQRQQREVAIG